VAAPIIILLRILECLYPQLREIAITFGPFIVSATFLVVIVVANFLERRGKGFHFAAYLRHIFSAYSTMFWCLLMRVTCKAVDDHKFECNVDGYGSVTVNEVLVNGTVSGIDDDLKPDDYMHKPHILIVDNASYLKVYTNRLSNSIVLEVYIRE